MGVFAEVVRFTVAFILLIAVVGKVRRPRVFIAAVRRLDLLPGALVRPAAYALLGAEAAVVVAVLLRFTVPIALGGAAGLFAVFAAVGVLALRRDQGDCGCLGGALALRFNHLMTAANVGVAVVAAWVAVTWSSEQTVFSAADTSVVVSAGLLAAVCYWVLSYAESVRKLGEETSRLIQAR